MIAAGGSASARPPQLIDIGLTAGDYPSGSADFRSSVRAGPSVVIGAPDGACGEALRRVAEERSNYSGVSTGANRGDQSYTADVLTGPVAATLAAEPLACPTAIHTPQRIAAPEDLRDLSPTIVELRTASGTVAGIKGFADVRGVAIAVSVTSSDPRPYGSRPWADAPVDSAAFWQLLRTQIEKVERAR